MLLKAILLAYPFLEVRPLFLSFKTHSDERPKTKHNQFRTVTWMGHSHPTFTCQFFIFCFIFFLKLNKAKEKAKAYLLIGCFLDYAILFLITF